MWVYPNCENVLGCADSSQGGRGTDGSNYSHSQTKAPRKKPKLYARWFALPSPPLIRIYAYTHAGATLHVYRRLE